MHFLYFDNSFLLSTSKKLAKTVYFLHNLDPVTFWSRFNFQLIRKTETILFPTKVKILKIIIFLTQTGQKFGKKRDISSFTGLTFPLRCFYND